MSERSIRAGKIRSRILRRIESPKIAWYINEERDFLSRYRTIIIYVADSARRWVFDKNKTRILPGFNRALNLTITHLGDTIKVRYDRSEVTHAPDFLDIQYVIEHMSSAQQASDRFKAWGAIRRISTTVFPID